MKPEEAKAKVQVQWSFQLRFMLATVEGLWRGGSHGRGSG